MHALKEDLKVFWPRTAILDRRESERSAKDWEVVDVVDLQMQITGPSCTNSYDFLRSSPSLMDRVRDDC